MTKMAASFLGALFGSRGGDETRDVALMRKTLPYCVVM
jgi:hypothetical protein